MLDIFKNMRIIDTKIVNGKSTNFNVTKCMKFINGQQMTIKSVLQLCDDI